MSDGHLAVCAERGFHVIEEFGLLTVLYLTLLRDVNFYAISVKKFTLPLIVMGIWRICLVGSLQRPPASDSGRSKNSRGRPTD